MYALSSPLQPSGVTGQTRNSSSGQRAVFAGVGPVQSRSRVRGLKSSDGQPSQGHHEDLELEVVVHAMAAAARSRVRGRAPAVHQAITHVQLSDDLAALIDVKRSRIIWVVAADGSDEPVQRKVARLLDLTKAKLVWVAGHDSSNGGESQNALAQAFMEVASCSAWQLNTSSSSFHPAQLAMLRAGLSPRPTDGITIPLRQLLRSSDGPASSESRLRKLGPQKPARKRLSMLGEWMDGQSGPSAVKVTNRIVLTQNRFTEDVWRDLTGLPPFMLGRAGRALGFLPPAEPSSALEAQHASLTDEEFLGVEVVDPTDTAVTLPSPPAAAGLPSTAALPVDPADLIALDSPDLAAWLDTLPDKDRELFQAHVARLHGGTHLLAGVEVGDGEDSAHGPLGPSGGSAEGVTVVRGAEGWSALGPGGATRPFYSPEDTDRELMSPFLDRIVVAELGRQAQLGWKKDAYFRTLLPRLRAVLQNERARIAAGQPALPRVTHTRAAAAAAAAPPGALAGSPWVTALARAGLVTVPPVRQPSAFRVLDDTLGGSSGEDEDEVPSQVDDAAQAQPSSAAAEQAQQAQHGPACSPATDPVRDDSAHRAHSSHSAVRWRAPDAPAGPQEGSGGVPRSSSPVVTAAVVHPAGLVVTVTEDEYEKLLELQALAEEVLEDTDESDAPRASGADVAQSGVPAPQASSHAAAGADVQPRVTVVSVTAEEYEQLAALQAQEEEDEEEEARASHKYSVVSSRDTHAATGAARDPRARENSPQRGARGVSATAAASQVPQSELELARLIAQQLEEEEAAAAEQGTLSSTPAQPLILFPAQGHGHVNVPAPQATMPGAGQGESSSTPASAAGSLQGQVGSAGAQQLPGSSLADAPWQDPDFAVLYEYMTFSKQLEEEIQSQAGRGAGTGPSPDPGRSEAHANSSSSNGAGWPAGGESYHDAVSRSSDRARSVDRAVSPGPEPLEGSVAGLGAAGAADALDAGDDEAAAATGAAAATPAEVAAGDGWVDMDAFIQGLSDSLGMSLVTGGAPGAGGAGEGSGTAPPQGSGFNCQVSLGSGDKDWALIFRVGEEGTGAGTGGGPSGPGGGSSQGRAADRLHLQRCFDADPPSMDHTERHASVSRLAAAWKASVDTPALVTPPAPNQQQHQQQSPAPPLEGPHRPEGVEQQSSLPNGPVSPAQVENDSESQATTGAAPAVVPPPTPTSSLPGGGEELTTTPPLTTATSSATATATAEVMPVTDSPADSLAADVAGAGDDDVDAATLARALLGRDVSPEEALELSAALAAAASTFAEQDSPSQRAGGPHSDAQGPGDNAPPGPRSSEHGEGGDAHAHGTPMTSSHGPATSAEAQGSKAPSGGSSSSGAAGGGHGPSAGAREGQAPAGAGAADASSSENSPGHTGLHVTVSDIVSGVRQAMNAVFGGGSRGKAGGPPPARGASAASSSSPRKRRPRRASRPPPPQPPGTLARSVKAAMDRAIRNAGHGMGDEVSEAAAAAAYAEEYPPSSQQYSSRRGGRGMYQTRTQRARQLKLRVSRAVREVQGAWIASGGGERARRAGGPPRDFSYMSAARIIARLVEVMHRPCDNHTSFDGQDVVVVITPPEAPQPSQPPQTPGMVTTQFIVTDSGVIELRDDDLELAQRVAQLTGDGAADADLGDGEDDGLGEQMTAADVVHEVASCWSRWEQELMGPGVRAVGLDGPQGLRG